MKAAGDTIMKPLNMQEWLFYENLHKLSELNLIPKHLFPGYRGRTRLPNSTGEMTDWLILENLCLGMTNPSIMDLKIGSSSMGATKAGAVKKVKQSVVKAISTSSTLGFRVAGMKVFVKDHHETKSKNYGLSLTQKNVHTAFEEFLSPNGVLQRDLLDQMHNQLKEIRAFFNQQQLLSFNSSSLLILYEHTRLIVRLIDFAHCFPLTGESNSLGFVSCGPINTDPLPSITRNHSLHRSLGGASNKSQIQ